MFACAPVLITAQESTHRLTFTVPNAPESALHPKDGRFQMTLTRWSTDEERTRLQATIKQEGADKLLNAFANVGAIGYLHWPGGLEYPVRYARRVPRPDGSVEVVLIADRGMWVWWDHPLSKGTQAPYTVIQVRLSKDGKGEGRVAFGSEISSDNEAGVTIANYGQKPLLLTDVREERTT
jgi:hypothetical protein